MKTAEYKQRSDCSNEKQPNHTKNDTSGGAAEECNKKICINNYCCNYAYSNCYSMELRIFYTYICYFLWHCVCIPELGYILAYLSFSTAT